MGNNKIDEMMESIVMSDELKNKIRENTTGKVVKFRKRSIKSIALVATLCIGILGAMTAVAANNAEKIEKYFMDILGYDADTQKALEEKGVYRNMELAYNEGDIISVTNDGITVSVKETVVDKNVLKALIQIKAEDGIELDDECYFENWIIKGFVEEVPDVSESPYEYYSTMEYAMPGVENLEGIWCIVDIYDFNKDGLESGDMVEITFDNIFKMHWITERLCELKDGATVMLDGEEYVVKKLGHISECQCPYTEEFDENCFCTKYSHIMADYNEYAYAVVNASTGEQYKYNEEDYLVVDSSEEGNYLEMLIEEEHIETISDGEWTLKWELSVNEECVTIPVNETIEANDLHYDIDNVEISPFSYRIYYSVGVEGLDSYEPLEIKIYMKNGSVYESGKEEADGDNTVVTTSRGYDGEWYAFNKALNLDNVEKISIEGKEYFISE